MIVTVKTAGGARLFALCFLLGSPRQLSRQTTDPILRVEAGMHTTLVEVAKPLNRIVVQERSRDLRVFAGLSIH